MVYDPEIISLAKQTVKEVLLGKKSQEWNLVSKDKIEKVWKNYARGRAVDEEDTQDIYQHILSNLRRIIANSLIHDYDYRMKEGITFIKDKDKRPPSTKYINYDEFIKFTGDRWTEELHKFENELKRAELAKTSEQQLLAIDRILDMVHGRGGVADWFVEGGDSFLNHLRDSKASNKSHRESLKKISDQIRILAGLVAGVKKVKIPYTKK